MTWSPPHPQAREALSATLIQILLFVENLNALAVETLAANIPQPIDSAANLALGARNDMATGKRRRARGSDWLQIMGRLGYALEVPQGLVDHLVCRLVRPREIREAATWSLEPSNLKPRPLTLGPPLHLDVVLHNLGPETDDFATREVGFEVVKECRVVVRPCDEPFNPIAIVEDFLVAVLNVREDTAEHFIQHWIRQEFKLHYNVDTKLAMQRVCDEINRRAYVGHGRSASARPSRPATMGINTVIEVIRQALEAGSSRPPPSESGLPVYYRQAVGTLLGLRLCGLFRHQTSIVDQEKIDASVKAKLHLRSCLSPLRRAEAGFIRTRIFGALTGISGFKTIFRGGLLPHPVEGRAFVLRGAAGSGKTVLALKMVADAAYRGRLGVYISAEESLSTIADRLVSFGMLDPRMFDVVVYSDDIVDQIRARRDNPDGRGLLVLCALGATDQSAAPHVESTVLDPGVIIRNVAEAAGDKGRWKWRAVVVDSLTALEMYDRSEQRMLGNDPMRIRTALLHLVDLINRHRFWGILLSELGSQQSDILSYVADTVIELGVDRSSLTRWFRIDKCRTQAFQFGEHHFRISESAGIRVYPSLAAVQSSLRRRTKSTLSEIETIALPKALGGLASVGSVGAKSSILIAGPERSGKSNLMLHLLTEPQVRQDGTTTRPRWPSSVLVVTFRTSEQQYRQRIRSLVDLKGGWDSIGSRTIRYFSPGRSLTSGQLVSEIRQHILRSQRASVPLERIVFDEVGSALSRIPGCAGDPLLWHTLNELTASEAITTFFVLTTSPHDRWLEDQLRSSVDYVFETTRDPQGLSLTLSKTPGVDEAMQPSVRFAISSGGSLVQHEPSEGFLPDGRRLGISVTLEKSKHFGVCALRHRGCTADREPAELLDVALSPSPSTLQTCPSCFTFQIENKLWRVQQA